MKKRLLVLFTINVDKVKFKENLQTSTHMCDAKYKVQSVLTCATIKLNAIISAGASAMVLLDTGELTFMTP